MTENKAQMFEGVASYKKRPSVQNSNRPKGSQWWSKDVWHIRHSGMTTLCGLDSSEYMRLGQVEEDQHLCSRCAKKAAPNTKGQDHE